MEKISIVSTVQSLSIISILTYLDIDPMKLQLYAILLTIDFITGIIKSRNRWKSSIAIAGLGKKIALILLIFSMGVTGKIMGYQDMTGVMKFFFNALALAELYSILGNIYEILTGKKQEKEFDGVALVISGIMNIISSKIKKLFVNENNNIKNKKDT